ESISPTDSLALVIMTRPYMSFLSSIVGHSAERVALSDQKGLHTYGEIVLRARHLAATFKDHGLMAEEPVAYLADKSAHAVVAMLGIWFAGAIAVPLSLQCTTDSILNQLKTLGCRFAVLPYPPVDEALVRDTFSQLQWLSAEQKHSKPAPLKVSNNNPNALIAFTAVTSLPIIITFSALAARAKILAQTWSLMPGDLVFHLLPMASARGVVGVLSSMVAGGICRLQPHHQSLNDALANEPSELILLDAVDYGQFIEVLEPSSGSMLHKRHATLVIVSTALTIDCLKDHWCQLPGITQQWVYSLPEGGILLSMDISRHYPSSFTGHPLTGVNVRIVDADGKASDSERGFLEVRSPQLFTTYFHQGEATTRTLNHGWLKTHLSCEINAAGDVVIPIP
ncbi:class I adenylate-forming enzyme family protein, partial [Candidatus Sororendozoicomonas aggregata]|uniref:class I adenylate-forming enzyme family protein n=1 Tax=Candidatus Sororendozoicomonas aggregata TaxID=3073239 RepID=UPI002ED201C4